VRPASPPRRPSDLDEVGADPGVGRADDLAAEIAERLTHRIKAEAEAARHLRRRFETHAALEDLRDILLLDADAGILDLDDKHVAVIEAGGNLDGAAGFRVVDGVADEIENDAVKLRREIDLAPVGDVIDPVEHQLALAHRLVEFLERGGNGAADLLLLRPADADGEPPLARGLGIFEEIGEMLAERGGNIGRAGREIRLIRPGAARELIDQIGKFLDIAANGEAVVNGIVGEAMLGLEQDTLADADLAALVEQRDDLHRARAVGREIGAHRNFAPA